MWTNRGKYLVLQAYFRQTGLPANFYIALVTNATSPTADTNTLSQLTEITSGNGYSSGGYQLTPGSTDFDVLTENDTDDLALIQVKDISWTAAGGQIPPTGNFARWAVLTDNNATIGSRQIIAYWNLVSDRGVVNTQTLTLRNLELDLGECP